MATKIKEYPIVGSKFRPPADILLGALPVGTTLWLIPEPFNEHDANAIAVWCDLEAPLRNARVADAMAKARDTDWITKKSLQLGYVPKQAAAYLKTTGFAKPVEGQLWFPFGSNIAHVKFAYDDNKP